MAITGFTPDSTNNGIKFVTAAKTGLSNAAVTNEVICLSGQTARLVGTLTISASQISVFNPIPGNGNNVSTTSILSGTITIQNQSAVFLNSESWTPNGTISDRIQMQLATIRDSIVVEQNRTAGILYLLANATVLNSSFRGIKWLETTGALTAFAGNSLIDTALGILNYQNGTLDLVGLNIPSTTTGYFGALGEGAANSSFRIWNPVAFNFNKILHTSSTTFAIQGYSATIRVRDSLGFVSGAGVFYKDDRASIGGTKALIASYTTNSSGVLTGTYNSQTGVTGTNTTRPTLWIQTAKTRLTGQTVAQNPANTLYTAVTVGGSYREYVYVVDNISSEVEIRSYLHLATDKLLTPTAEAGKINADGSVNFYQDILLEVDSGVTQTNTTTVSGYTGIAHTASTITISQARTISEVYDSRKLYWRNTDGITPPTRSSDIADFGNANIVINAALSSDSKYSQIRTTGTITFGTGGSTNAIAQDSTGTRTTLTLTGVVVGSTVRIWATDGTLITEQTASSSTFIYPYVWTTDVVRNIGIFKQGYYPFPLLAVNFTSRGRNLPTNQRAIRGVIYSA